MHPPSVDDDPIGSRGVGGKADDNRGAWLRQHLAQRNATLSPAEQAQKREKMAASAHSFYRGTASLFYADLGADARLNIFGAPGTRTFIQGDLHLLNFGAFDDGAGDIVFDLNDFDEAIIADYQLDLWRLAISLVLVASEHGFDGRSRTVVDAFVESYLDQVARLRGTDRERTLSFRARNTYGQLDDLLEETERDNSRRDMLRARTDVTEGWRHFDLRREDQSAVEAATFGRITQAWVAYANTLQDGRLDSEYLAIKDVCIRLGAGTGSLGSLRYYVLVEGPSTSNDDDVILDVKHQRQPASYGFLPAEVEWRNEISFTNPAERVITAERALLTFPNPHLGWLLLDGSFFSVRERSPFKESLRLEELDSSRELRRVAEQLGLILASAHARGDRDFDSSLVPQSFDRDADERFDGSHDEFRDLVWQVASSYAAQVAQDYQAFLQF